MDAGQLFEQLQKKSNQNANDIAVVLDAMITTINNKIGENKSVEFADFGHFTISDYGKTHFVTSPEFEKVVNYKYQDLDAVPLMDAMDSNEQATIQTQEEFSTDQDNSVISDEILAEETALINPVEDEAVTEHFSEETSLSDDLNVLNQSSLMPEEEKNEENRQEIEENIELSDLSQNQNEENYISSQVTESLDAIHTMTVDPSELESKNEFPMVSVSEEKQVEMAESKTPIKKLDTVIEDSGIIENVKEKETMQSYQSLGNSSPRLAENDDYGGLTNADLGGESDSKRWIVIIGVVIVAIAVAIWFAFHLDKKSSDSTTASNNVKADSVTTQTVTEPAPVVTEQPKTPTKTTDKKAADTKTKTTEPAKKATKVEPKATKSANGEITVNYAALGGVSGIKDMNGAYTISVSSWTKKTAAEKEKSKWDAAGVTASVKEIYLVDKGGYWYRVQIGRYSSRKAALSAVDEVKAEVPDAYVDTVE